MEDLWRYYETIEDVTEEELEEYAIEKLLDDIDHLKLW